MQCSVVPSVPSASTRDADVCSYVHTALQLNDFAFTGHEDCTASSDVCNCAAATCSTKHHLILCRMHPLTRLLRSALMGTCHRLIIPPSDPAAGELPAEHARALDLVEKLRSLPQLKSLCDVAEIDACSDVAKWMRYENRSLRTDLKGAREKIALLQKYLGARGDNEMKTWDLWRELQVSESTAQELRDEVRDLKAMLASARNAAAAAAASSQLARARAQTDAARSAAARQDAAALRARANAMEQAVDRMAKQLANVASGAPDEAAAPCQQQGKVCTVVA